MSHPHLAPVVLIVEDEPLRTVMVDVVQDEGFRVIEANKVTEALVALEAQPDITMVAADVEMPPEARGHELASQVKVKWSYIRFVVTSCGVWPNPSDMPNTAVFLPKPWTSVSLVDHVWEAVDCAKIVERE